MFQNVLIDPKVSKGKEISLLFSVSFGIFVSFRFFIKIFVFSISYKCKYVLFHLNMLKLFQDINMFLKNQIKLVFNKNFSLKYLIQGFNPHLLS